MSWFNSIFCSTCSEGTTHLKGPALPKKPSFGESLPSQKVPAPESPSRWTMDEGFHPTVPSRTIAEDDQQSHVEALVAQLPSTTQNSEGAHTASKPDNNYSTTSTSVHVVPANQNLNNITTGLKNINSTDDSGPGFNSNNSGSLKPPSIGLKMANFGVKPSHYSSEATIEPQGTSTGSNGRTTNPRNVNVQVPFSTVTAQSHIFRSPILNTRGTTQGKSRPRPPSNLRTRGAASTSINTNGTSKTNIDISAVTSAAAHSTNIGTSNNSTASSSSKHIINSAVPSTPASTIYSAATEHGIATATVTSDSAAGATSTSSTKRSTKRSTKSSKTNSSRKSHKSKNPDKHPNFRENFVDIATPRERQRISNEVDRRSCAVMTRFCDELMKGKVIDTILIHKVYLLGLVLIIILSS